jgi:hypothetical protein
MMVLNANLIALNRDIASVDVAHLIDVKDGLIFGWIWHYSSSVGNRGSSETNSRFTQDQKLKDDRGLCFVVFHESSFVEPLFVSQDFLCSLFDVK